MKRVFAAVLLGLALVGIAHSDATTTRIGIIKPSIGSTGWGTKINSDFDIVDSSVAVLGKTNAFTSTCTFSQSVGVGVGSPNAILDVSGTTSDTAGSNHVLRLNSAFGFRFDAGTGHKMIFDSLNGIWNTTPALVIDRVGPLIGIGITTPTATLEVNGTAKFDGQVSMSTQSAARVHHSANQAIPSGANTEIAYNVKDWDNQSEFNTTTSSFVVTNAGKYHVRVQALFASPGNGTIIKVGIKKNSTIVSENDTVCPFTGDCSLGITDDLNASASDTIAAFAFQNSGSNKNLTADTTLNFMTILRVQ